MDKILQRAAQFRADSVNEQELTAEFIISTEAVDSYGTVFKAEGWDLTRYQGNPIVFYNHAGHNNDPDLIIGTSEVRQEAGQLIGKIYFEDPADNPLAGKVFRKVQRGILRGASIGTSPKEWRMGDKAKGEDPEVVYFTRTELLEWSIVSLPSNPEALVRMAAQVDEIKKELIPEPQPAQEPKSLPARIAARLIINKNV